MPKFYIRKIESCEQCPNRFVSGGTHAHCSGKEGFRENFLPTPFLGETTPPDWCPLPNSCVETVNQGDKK